MKYRCFLPFPTLQNTFFSFSSKVRLFRVFETDADVSNFLPRNRTLDNDITRYGDADHMGTAPNELVQFKCRNIIEANEHGKNGLNIKILED